MTAGLTPGFADPVHGAQQCFRALLDGMSRPGRVVELAPAAIAGIVPPPPLCAGAAAVLLTLLDAETTVHLAGAFERPALLAWLRFHCGVRDAGRSSAAFVVVDALHADAALWSTLNAGSDEAPQTSATMLIQVPALAADPSGLALRLRGPGVKDAQRLAVDGLAPAFWHARVAQQAIAPRGVDLVLVAGMRIAALPRSTRLAVEE
jgi:alpha-D-ribose 1-methylphosphonate 5-triphosphate synthase subunit PhnH